MSREELAARLLAQILQAIQQADAGNCRMQSWVITSIADGFMVSNLQTVSDLKIFKRHIREIILRLDRLDRFAKSPQLQASIKIECLAHLAEIGSMLQGGLIGSADTANTMTTNPERYDLRRPRMSA